MFQDKFVQDRTQADKIEILSIELLDEHQALIEDLKQFARSLRLEFGWHYLLDLSWIISQLGPVRGKRIMDAGAGTGVLQWYLARQGAEVISVDRASRAALPIRFRRRFRAQGLRPQDLRSAGAVLQSRFAQGGRAKITAPLREMVDALPGPQSDGRVLIYNTDLTQLDQLADESLDAVVSVSALEHNTPEGLVKVLEEILRVLKPGGVLAATLVAAKDQDWWHDESSAWCYTDDSLRRAFDLLADTPSNYERYEDLFEALRDCAELRDNLASFYSKSAKNGMPWGVWDPQYQPVGVCKIKQA